MENSAQNSEGTEDSHTPGPGNHLSRLKQNDDELWEEGLKEKVQKEKLFLWFRRRVKQFHYKMTFSLKRLQPRMEIVLMTSHLSLSKLVCLLILICHSKLYVKHTNFMNIIYVSNILKLAIYISIWMSRSCKSFMYVSAIIFKTMLRMYMYTYTHS